MFADEAALAHALARLRAARVGPLETYTPAPLGDAGAGSPVPAIVLLAGVLGGAASFALQSYAATRAYRFHVGGRPHFAWISFIPTTFENAVLVAILAGIVAFFWVCGLPRHYDPVDQSEAIRRASRDRWFVQVASENDAVLRQAREVLRGLRPISVEELAG